MLGFDAPQIYYSDNFGETGDAQTGDNATATNLAIKKRFKEFLRQFSGAGNFSYKYRDSLKRNYTLRQFWISVNLEDLARFVGIQQFVIWSKFDFVTFSHFKISTVYVNFTSLPNRENTLNLRLGVFILPLLP